MFGKISRRVSIQQSISSWEETDQVKFTSLICEYKGDVDYLSVGSWHSGSQFQMSGLIKPRNGARQNILFCLCILIVKSMHRSFLSLWDVNSPDICYLFSFTSVYLTILEN